MTKNQIVLTIFITALGILGIFITTWWGGFLAGISFWSILLMTIGKVIVEKATRKLDKQIRDIVVEKTEQNV